MLYTECSLKQFAYVDMPLLSYEFHACNEEDVPIASVDKQVVGLGMEVS